MKQAPKTFHLYFGIRYLLSEWRPLFTLKDLRQDCIAGATVACIAIPLSLAIALASNVQPAVGLLTAIIGGIVCSSFGGTPLAVSGPAAAMAILVGSIVQRYGFSALLIMGLGCGILQLFSGVFGVGKLIRYVPLPVILGFTAGIGVLIFVGQLPRACGLPAAPQSEVIHVLSYVLSSVFNIQWAALGLALGTMVFILGLPRVFPRVPAPLLAVLVMTAIGIVFDLPVTLIGSIPRTLPLPQLPHWPEKTGFYLLECTVVFYLLASLETLLSSSAVDKLVSGKKHHPDQELIGQGIGNVISALFGGIPITGVIARSALNVQSGAKTRRSGIIHALFLILTVLFFAPWIEKIPVPVLSGVLFAVALRMMSPTEFLHLWKVSRIEALTYLITFVTLVAVDLIAGVQAGILSAFLIMGLKLGYMKSHFHKSEFSDSYRFALNGPLTFMSSGKLHAIRLDIEKNRPKQNIVIDMSGVTLIDSSAAEQIVEWVQLADRQESRIALQGLSQIEQKTLTASDPTGLITRTFSVSESETFQMLQESTTPIERLISGVEQFHKNSQNYYQPLFTRLAETQNPHTLFITCSDSRINPNLITSTDPGELFIVRNVGNMIPAYGLDDLPAEGAAIEFALHVLNVKEIVVCGHSGCAAIKAIVSRQNFSELPHLDRWLSATNQIYSILPAGSQPNDAARLNTLTQLEHLKTYPLILDGLKKNSIRLHAWYYDIRNGEIEEWNEKVQAFTKIGTLKSSEKADATAQPAVAGPLVLEGSSS